MTQNHSTSAETTPQTEQPPKPDSALKRLEKLISKWDLKGRTLDSKEDNISGQVIIEWLPGGFFLQQRGEMDFMGFKAQSLEVIGYDPATDTFPSTVYSSMNGVALAYHWDVQGDVVSGGGSGIGQATVLALVERELPKWITRTRTWSRHESRRAVRSRETATRVTSILG